MTMVKIDVKGYIYSKRTGQGEFSTEVFIKNVKRIIGVIVYNT